MNPNYLPENKRLVFAVGGTAAVIVLGLIIFQLNIFFQDEDTPSESSGVVASNSQNTPGAESLEKDTDGDGLKDWEELLWETEIENADTDGDGTSDGQEVAENRDPAVGGPNDSLQGTSTAQTQTAGVAAQNPNLDQEDAAARSFFARFLELRKSGTLSQSAASRLGNLYQGEMLGEERNIDFNFNTYGQSDILISANSNDQALRNYGNEMGSIISSYPPVTENETELQLYAEALENGTDQSFEKIDPYIERYEDIMNASLEVTVPERAVEIHLNYVNALNALKQNAEAMRRGSENAVQSINYVNQYTQEQESRVVSAFLSIPPFFENNNINFNNNESGALYAGFAVNANN